MQICDSNLIYSHLSFPFRYFLFFLLIQVTSALTGRILVEDVIYKAINDDDVYKDSIFRRLIFLRTENLVQSEALLSREGSNGISSEVEKEKEQEAPKPRNKGKQRKFDSHSSGSHGEGHLFLYAG